ncbi:MAG: hypothetical protein JKY66_08270 [Spongiibacteraceae bacterium]|nr:hypothetical protein [Spongiibacteraceae bacterium]
MQEIQTLNKQFGYYDFYSIPIKPCEGTDRAMLTIAHQSMGPIELKRSVTECSPDLSLLCEAIDFVTTHKFSEFFCQDKHKKSTQINPKPLRVLNTLANNDLTINQVADKLCISVVTANQHLKTVRRSLGTHTNYAAIKQAVLNNLIQFK